MNMNRLIAVAAVVAASAILPSRADRTISADYTLQADEDWTADGTITVDAGVKIDLNGHSLRVKAITGDGYVTDLSNDTAPSIAPEYVPLQYLQSTTAGQQYIDTGYCHTSTSFVEVKFNYPALAATTSSDKWYSYFGGGQRDQTYSFGGWMWGKSSNNTHWKSTGQNEGTGANAAANTDYIAHLDKQSTCWITDGNNSTILGKTWTGKNSDWGSTTPVTAYLFGHHKRQNSDGTDAGLYTTPYVGVKIYWCRISTSRSNGTRVRDYVPVRRLTDGAIGMYDKVSKTLYRNANSGADFTAGAATENLAATDADIAAAGSLILDVDDTLSTSTLPLIRGKMKLVKAGAGTLVADKANLAHTCGTEILEGMVSCGQSGNGNTPFGVAGCTVTVGTNTTGAATFDLNGKSGFTDYTFVLAGGTLKNSANIANPHQTATVKSVRLTADSTMSADRSFGIVAGTSTATSLDLGGHTLTVTGANVFYVDRCTATSEGRIVCKNRTVEFWYGASDLHLVTLEMGTNSQLRINGTSGSHNASPLLLGGYVAKTASVDSDSGFIGTAKVYGTFRPNTDYFHGCEVQDGATIDLGGRLTALPLQGSNVVNGANYGMRDISFAAAAKAAGASGITVDIGSRTDVRPGDRLIAWSADPEVLSWRLECNGASAADALNLTVAAKEDGLYAKDSREPKFAEWDVSEGGWKFYLEDETEYTDEWSDFSEITVRFDTYAEYAAIKAQNVVPARFVMTGLSAGEGSGLLDMRAQIGTGVDFEMAPNAVIDIGAYTNMLPDSVFTSGLSFTVTSSAGGVLLVDVAQLATLNNSVATISGNVKLLKRGLGTFIATKTGQTYTGGTVIEEGLLKCASAGTDKPLGDYSGDVVVAADGVFDLAGKINFTGYRFVLRGGKIENTVSVSSYHEQPWLANVRLEADSEFQIAGGQFGMINKSGSSYIASTLDLNGYTLTIFGSAQFYVVKCTATAGTIVMRGLSVEFWQGASDFSRVHVITEGDQRLCIRPQAPVSFGDYIADSTGQSNNTDGYNGTLSVSGTFRPTTGYFNGCTLQNGATLDLGGWTNGTFNTHGLYAPGAAAARTTATFAAGADISLSLEGRRDLSRMAKAKQYIVAWESSAKPADSVTFTLDPATVGRSYKLRRDDGGLKLLSVGFMLIVK